MNLYYGQVGKISLYQDEPSQEIFFFKLICPYDNYRAETLEYDIALVKVTYFKLRLAIVRQTVMGSRHNSLNANSEINILVS